MAEVNVRVGKNLFFNRETDQTQKSKFSLIFQMYLFRKKTCTSDSFKKDMSIEFFQTPQNQSSQKTLFFIVLSLGDFEKNTFYKMGPFKNQIKKVQINNKKRYYLMYLHTRDRLKVVNVTRSSQFEDLQYLNFSMVHFISCI